MTEARDDAVRRDPTVRSRGGAPGHLRSSTRARPRLRGGDTPMTSADVLIIGASAFVGGESRAGVAVAVAAGRIVALGREDEIGELAGPRTRTVHAPGGLVVAGFQDAHIHPAEGGLVRIRCNLEELPGVGSYAEAIRAYAVARPDVPWILGGVWAQPH